MKNNNFWRSFWIFLIFISISYAFQFESNRFNLIHLYENMLESNDKFSFQSTKTISFSELLENTKHFSFKRILLSLSPYILALLLGFTFLRIKLHYFIRTFLAFSLSLTAFYLMNNFISILQLFEFHNLNNILSLLFVSLSIIIPKNKKQAIGVSILFGLSLLFFQFAQLIFSLASYGGGLNPARDRIIIASILTFALGLNFFLIRRLRLNLNTP